MNNFCKSKAFSRGALIVSSLVFAPAASAVGPVIALDRVSVANDGTQFTQNSYHGVISADGRYVAFDNGSFPYYVYLRDRVAGTTELVSVALGGALANNYSNYPAISGDGRYVAFASAASNLVLGDTNATVDIFVRDRLTATTVRASVAGDGPDTAGGGNVIETPNRLSADGRYVVFVTYARLTANATNNAYSHIYRRDLVANTTELVDVNPAGVAADRDGQGGSLSADGRFVVFASGATDIVAGLNFGGGVYVRDMLLGVSRRR